MDKRRFEETRKIFGELMGSLKEALGQAGSRFTFGTVFDRIYHAVDLRDAAKVMDAVAFLTDLRSPKDGGAPATVRASAIWLMDALSGGPPTIEQWIGFRRAIDDAYGVMLCADAEASLRRLEQQHAKLLATMDAKMKGAEPQKRRTAAADCDSTAHLDMLDRFGRR